MSSSVAAQAERHGARGIRPPRKHPPSAGPAFNSSRGSDVDVRVLTARFARRPPPRLWRASALGARASPSGDALVRAVMAVVAYESSSALVLYLPGMLAAL